MDYEYLEIGGQAALHWWFCNKVAVCVYQLSMLGDVLWLVAMTCETARLYTEETETLQAFIIEMEKRIHGTWFDAFIYM